MEIRGSLHPEFVETPSAKEAVLFSNTPSFLLDRLRKDSASSYIDQKMNKEEIASLLEERSKTPPASPVDLLWIYVLLAALSLKSDLLDFKDKLANIDLTHVQWGDEIRRAILQGLTPSTFLGVEYEAVGKKSPVSVSTDIVKGEVIPEGTRR